MAPAPIALLAGLPTPVLVPAHGVGTRADLPLPFTALLVGASLALVASFVALGALCQRGLGLPAAHQDFIEIVRGANFHKPQIPS